MQEMKRKIITTGIVTLATWMTIMVSGCKFSGHSHPVLIEGWSDKSNKKLEYFLKTTDEISGNKVAVFDCDGTLLGQYPYYLNDEAINSYVLKHYKDNPDPYCKAKWKLAKEFYAHINEMSNDEYNQYCARLMEGMSLEEIHKMGRDCFKQKYKNKIFPQMKQLVSILKQHGFEVFVVTGSFQYIYSGVINDELHISPDHVIGVKTTMTKDGKMTDLLMTPIPMEHGKVEAIRKYIKTYTLLVCGNSRGDLEMMKDSKGIKVILNPDDKKKLDELGGRTLKEYWQNDPTCIIEKAVDKDENIHFVSSDLKFYPNTEIK